MTLEWSDELYSTGYSEIDDENRKIVKMVNELLTGISKGNLNKSMRDALYFLEIYTVEHFRNEEALMKQTSCAAYAQNKKQHLEFEKELWSFKNRFNTDGYNRKNLKEFIVFVTNWITEHIQKTDIQLRVTLELEESEL